ncbi:MAG: thioredoxin domain-containing protein, partial [Bacteroidota bacterium]
FISCLLYACSNGQNTGYSLLEPSAFSEKLKSSSDITLVDVRTPDEFSAGHLPNALNIDWNGDQFNAATEKLDKSKPVFVYCMSGGRSHSAAQDLQKRGFKNITELKGGILKWRAAGLPEQNGVATTNINGPSEMTKMDMDKMIIDNKLIIFDFFAEWCGPCKKLKPELEALEAAHKGQVKVVRIDVDKNKNLARELQITEIPIIMIYKNKQIQWTGTGYFPMKDIEVNCGF